MLQRKYFDHNGQKTFPSLMLFSLPRLSTVLKSWCCKLIKCSNQFSRLFLSSFSIFQRNELLNKQNAVSSNLWGTKQVVGKEKKNPTQFQNWGVAGSGCSVMCEGSQQFSVSLVFGWTYFCEASFSAMTAVKAALDFQIPVSPKYQAKIKKIYETAYCILLSPEVLSVAASL